MTSSVPAPPGEFDHGVARELRELAELTRALQAEGGRRATLQTVCELAAKVIGADHASITVRTHGGFRTLARTSDLPEVVHQIQCDTGGGPGVDAGDGHATWATGNLSAETCWPEFAARMAEHAGVRSMLSNRLFARDAEVGFLHAFAHRPDAFDTSSVAVFGIFAAHAAVVLQAAEEQERADNLEIALHNSRRIGTAIGILMHRHRVDEATAFDLLRRRSQDSNRKLSAIAEDVVRTGLL